VSERSLVLVKPDGVRRGLIGEVIGRLEAKGFTLAALELRLMDRETIERHYAEHEGKPFYAPLVEFMTSGPTVAMIVEGERVIESFRTLAGPTDPITALPGTIRGDHATITRENIVHGSDSVESAEREIKNFFPDFS
jgi:nucleoside-diphosphate kinase